MKMNVQTLGRRGFMAWLGAAGWVPAAARSAPPLLLAQDWQAGLNPADYLVSEKLDGVRAYWSGSQLLSRSGLPIRAPTWFTARLPMMALDGELWLGRRQFDVVSSLARADRTDDALWRSVSLQLFELPGASGTFAQRAQALAEIAARIGGPSVRSVEQGRITNEADLRKRLDDVVRAGGEGLMLHRADAPYVTGRHEVLRKLKPLHDAEALVIGHTPGTGKYQGLLGALEVQTQEGLRFKLGTGFSDADRRTPPPVGSTVTYTYRDVTPSGRPRFAAYLRRQEE
jgi:DNA ligase 1